MTLASEGSREPGHGYASALDVGGGRGGDNVPSGVVPAEGAAPPLPEAEDAAAPAPATRANLDEAIKVALLDAVNGAATIDQVHETVNAAPGPHVARGVIEARILEWEKAGVVHRNGDTWVLGAAARAEVEQPGVVLERRAEVVASIALMLLPDGNQFTDLEGVTALELEAFLHGSAADDADDLISGALTTDGLQARPIPADVLKADLDALVRAGVLVTRTATEEAVRRGEEEADTPVEGDDEEKAHNEVDGGEDVEGGDNDEEPGTTELRVIDARPPAYTFAPLVLERVFVLGAMTVASATMPAASPDVTAAATASVADGTAFQRSLLGELETWKARAVRAEAFLPKLRLYLATRKLEFIVDEVLGAGAPPPVPAARYFGFKQTVRMDDHEKAVLLGEIDDVERQIAEETTRLEGVKLSYGSARTTAKERLAALADDKKELLSAARLPERTYTVEAYTVLDASGPVPRSITRARSDNRILRDEELRPSEVLAALAQSEVVPAGPGSPPPAQFGLGSVDPAKLAGAAAEAVDGAPSVANGVAAVTVKAVDPAAVSDAAADAAAAATKSLEERAAAIKARSKGHLEISVEGLRPHALAGIIGIGEEGLLVTSVADATASAAGITNAPGFGALVGLTADKLVTADVVEKRDGRLFFNVGRALLAIVAADSEHGIRVLEMPERFAEKVGCVLTDSVRAVLGEAIDDAVARADLARGPLPGDMGDLLWIAGEVDPRRGEAPNKPASTGVAPQPRRKGGGRAAVSAGAAPAAPKKHGKGPKKK